ncbi:unnamed protein product, partial [Symbiodinium sp. KB8]
MFRCRSEVIDGRQYLAADPAVECYTPQHVVAMAAAGVLAAVFNVGVPLALLFTLRRSATKLRSATMLNRYGFLYYGYSLDRRLYWWETVVLLRKFLVLAVVSSLSEPFLQSLLGLAILVVFLVVQVHAKPYERSLFNHLETAVLGCLTATQLISLMYFRTASSSLLDEAAMTQVDVVVTAALLLINGCCFLLLLTVGIREHRRQRYSKRAKQRSDALLKRSRKSPWHGSLVEGAALAQCDVKAPAAAPAVPVGCEDSDAVVLSYPWQWQWQQREL